MIHAKKRPTKNSRMESCRVRQVLAMIACLAWLVFAPVGVIHAQLLADVDFSKEAAKDPHPVTYFWLAEAKQVIDPGIYTYQYYYTGTIQPDARVKMGSSVRRIAIPKAEWIANKKKVITKLTLFYQVTNNLPPTALADLQKLQEPP